jgi:hypothetical protein
MHNRISRAESLCTVYNVCESCKCVSDEFCLPLWHSTSGRPVCPGRQRQTKNACSRMHSAFLPHPSVLQSTTCLSSTVPASTATLHPKNQTDKTSLTFDGRITSWSLRRTETLSLFSTHNPALCSDSAQFLFAQIHRLGVADAPPVGVADAPRRTTAFVLSIDISTFSVRPARILQTLFVSAFLTLNQGISDETGRTRTMRFSLDHSALSVNPASFILGTRIPAGPIRTATFISFAIRVKSAFVRFALDFRISLVAVRTQTDLSAVCRLTNRVFAAIVRIFAHVLTFLVSANFRRRTVVVRAASWEAGASGADLATRARLLRGAFVSAFARSAGLTARTIFRGATGFRAKSDLVAFARTVTFGRHFSASHQRISQEVCRTTALSNVIFNFAACTDATSGVVIARV